MYVLLFSLNYQNERKRVPRVSRRLLLAFVDSDSLEPMPELELEFHRQQGAKARELRFPIIIAVLFSALEIWMDWLGWTNSDYVFAVGGFNTSLSIRSGIIVWGLGLLSVPYFRFFDVISDESLIIFQFFSVILFQVATIAVPLVVVGRVGLRTALVNILMQTIINNVGVRFTILVPAIFALFLLWTCVSFATTSDNPTTLLIWMLWVLLSLVANVVISFGREFYLRTGFLLTQQVQSESKIADEFLYHMLPRQVALKLREGHKGIAEEFSDLSILYSDIKGFTQYSATSTPENVVQLLSQLFTAFDRLNDQFGVYKIQTIGDAYVCSAGLPFVSTNRNLFFRDTSASEHAVSCVRMGLAMLEAVALVRTVEGGTISMRIGIHTGKVVAGVVGTKKLRYDIWGVDCLVAAMCESNSEPGCILLSAATESLVRGTFVTIPGQAFDVQGKSQPVVTFLLRPSDQVTSNKQGSMLGPATTQLISAASAGTTSAVTVVVDSDGSLNLGVPGRPVGAETLTGSLEENL
jgi:class 3 adenylate cyclase